MKKLLKIIGILLLLLIIVLSVTAYFIEDIVWKIITKAAYETAQIEIKADDFSLSLIRAKVAIKNLSVRSETAKQTLLTLKNTNCSLLQGKISLQNLVLLPDAKPNPLLSIDKVNINTELTSLRSDLPVIQNIIVDNIKLFIYRYGKKDSTITRLQELITKIIPETKVSRQSETTEATELSIKGIKLAKIQLNNIATQLVDLYQGISPELGLNVSEIKFKDLSILLNNSLPQINLNELSLSQVKINHNLAKAQPTLVSLEQFNMDVLAFNKQNISIDAILIEKPIIEARSLGDQGINWLVLTQKINSYLGLEPSSIGNKEVTKTETTNPLLFDLKYMKMNEGMITYYLGPQKNSGPGLENLVFTLNHTGQGTANTGTVPYKGTVTASVRYALGSSLTSQFELSRLNWPCEVDFSLKVNDLHLASLEKFFPVEKQKYAFNRVISFHGGGKIRDQYVSDSDWVIAIGPNQGDSSDKLSLFEAAGKLPNLGISVEGYLDDRKPKFPKISLTGGIGSAITDFFKGFTTNKVQLIKDLGSKITDTSGKLLEGATGGTEGTVEKLGEKAEKVKDKIFNIFKKQK